MVSQVSTRTEDVPGDEVEDEFDAYLARAFQDPAFVVAYGLAQIKAEMRRPRPLAVNGHDYRRRQRARLRRKR